MFRRFFSKEKSVQPEPQHPYMTETVIFANQKTEFVNPTKKIRKTCKFRPVKSTCTGF